MSLSFVTCPSTIPLLIDQVRPALLQVEDKYRQKAKLTFRFTVAKLTFHFDLLASSFLGAFHLMLDGVPHCPRFRSTYDIWIR